MILHYIGRNTMKTVDESGPSLYEKLRNFNTSEFTKIKLLKNILNDIVETQCKINPSLCRLTKKIRKNIVNCLIMAYIEMWLENDELSKQSIDSYLKNIFQMQSQCGENMNDALSAVRREMYNGEKFIRANFCLENESSKQKNIDHKKMLDKVDYGNKYSLLELEEMYKAAVEALSIHKDIFKNDKPYHSKNRNRKSAIVNIVQRDIEEYEGYLNHIKSLINEGNIAEDESEDGMTKNDKEFVVKCLFVWKHERTYRYKLTAMLAKYLCDNRYSMKSIHIPDTIKYYCSAYPIAFSDEQIKVSYSYFVKKYDKIISGGFSDKDTRYQAAISIVRACFDICFSLVCRGFRTTTLLGSWDDNDFEDVACFMIKDYGIKECLEMPDTKKAKADKVSPYSYIRKLFEIPDYIDAKRTAYYKENSKRKKNSKK